jgi:signal transduction histidine kinase/CheY-like chemotaxis protein
MNEGASARSGVLAPALYEKTFDLPWMAVGLAAFILVALLSFVTSRDVITANEHARNWNRELASLEKIGTLLDEAESGQRGFLLTGRQQYLNLYDNATRVLASEAEFLRGDAAFQKYSREQARLRSLIGEKQQELFQTIQIERSSGRDAALKIVNTDRGEKVMEEIRSSIQNLQSQIRSEADTSSAHVEQRARQATIVTSSASLLLFLALGFANFKLQRERHAAEAANLAKSSFLASMSHELRTPLNAIIGYSEMLVEEAEDAGGVALVPDLQKIQIAGKHLLLLINSVLDLSKIEAGKMDLFLESFSVSALAKEVGAVIEPLASKNRNEFRVVVDPHSGSMHADQTKLRQTLYNLLSNACKFTQDGSVELRVKREGVGAAEMISFEVADTGIGMTPEQVGQIFIPFVQGDSSTSRRFGGTGLGLAISQRFIELLGGKLIVQSTFGKGSIFSFKIPAAGITDESTHVPLVENVPAETGVLERTIVSIDDEPSVHELLARSLTRHGFRVYPARSGEEGIRLARKLRPTAITLDVMMPGMDGWAVLSLLKADPELSEIPIIMLTIADNRNLGYSLGATDYLTKPIDREKLVSLLTRYRRADFANSALVVEDDPDARDLVARSLKSEGWKVAEAENGHAALQIVATARPGVILLDLMMPEMDGFDFVAELRKLPEGKTIPVIVITAKDLTSEDRARLNGQVSRILQKGAFSLEELLSEVSRLVLSRVRTNAPGQHLAEPPH